MLFVFALFLKILATSGQECFDDGNEFCIDQEDILSVDLLPGSFLLIDQYQNENDSRILGNISVDGTFNKALDEMDFHRKRMNEYLCHGFMAEEILKEVGPPRIKRRLDASSTGSLIDFLGESNVTVHDKLLSDEGSLKYKDWLQRTTTLDDIYRHYAPPKKTRNKQEVRREDNDDIDEFDGEVTGYAMQAPLPSGKIGGYFAPSEDHLISPSSGYDLRHGDYYGHYGDFYPSIHEEHYYEPPNNHEENHHEYHHKPVHHYVKGKSHDLSLKDFFEIALTALAFLAFGLFLIQLMMNVTNVSTASAASIIQADIGTRYKRQASTFSFSPYSGNEELNELSHRVMRSIEAALVTEQDSGNCLRRSLCEDNKYSREINDDRRIWIPVWSLGMSWISGRMLNKAPWSAMLDSVKASVLGLGGADCLSLFPGCNLKRERIKRRRRRRK